MQHRVSTRHVFKNMQPQELVWNLKVGMHSLDMQDSLQIATDIEHTIPLSF